MWRLRAHFPRAYMQLHSASCVKMQGKVFRAVFGARSLRAAGGGGGGRLRNSVRSQGQGNVFRKRILSTFYYFRFLSFNLSFHTVYLSKKGSLKFILYPRRKLNTAFISCYCLQFTFSKTVLYLLLLFRSHLTHSSSFLSLFPSNSSTSFYPPL